MDGHLYAHIDLGSGPIKVKASKKRVDDGKWHDVSLQRDRKEGHVKVDDNTTKFITPGIHYMKKDCAKNAITLSMIAKVNLI